MKDTHGSSSQCISFPHGRSAGLNGGMECFHCLYVLFVHQTGLFQKPAATAKKLKTNVCPSYQKEGVPPRATKEKQIRQLVSHHDSSRRAPCPLSSRRSVGPPPPIMPISFLLPEKNYHCIVMCANKLRQITGMLAFSSFKSKVLLNQQKMRKDKIFLTGFYEGPAV
eukprot:scaffold309163_cov17-Tisochrysis_lutea.AAC.2